MSKTSYPYLFFRVSILIFGIQSRCKKGSCIFPEKILEATVELK